MIYLYRKKDGVLFCWLYCRWCTVDCKSNTSAKNIEKISFFRLPKDKNLQKAWLCKLKRNNLPPLDRVRLCHYHFEESCFQRDLKVFIYMHIYSIPIDSRNFAS